MVDTDTSGTGMGGVLSQGTGECEEVIAYLLNHYQNRSVTIVLLDENV